MSGSDTDVGVKRMKREDSDDDYDSSHTNHTKSDGVSLLKPFAFINKSTTAEVKIG